jgi:uncharacterized membrane protein YfcA
MTQFIVLAIALLAAGALVGLLAGLFGVGGGTVVVPILYEVFVWLGVPDDLRMPLCAGTSLALIIPTSIASFTTHRKAASIDATLLRKWILPVVAGVLAGTLLARYAPAAMFKSVFVLIALATAVRLSFPDLLPKLGNDVPQRFVAPYGLVIGASASLIGIGGGLLSNMVMTLHGRAIHQAVATSSGVGVMVSLPGAIGYMAAGWDKTGLPPYSIGFVSIVAVLLLMPASLLTAKLGARVAHAVSKRRLEVAFALYLLLVSGQFCASLALG